MVRTTAESCTVAMTRSRPPQRGQARTSASAAAARRQLLALATWLDTSGHAGAAASLREGLEETLTVLKLNLPPRLRRFFATTNCIENLIGTLRHVAQKPTRYTFPTCCASPASGAAKKPRVPPIKARLSIIHPALPTVAGPRWPEP
jgi:hypothetical protein